MPLITNSSCLVAKKDFLRADLKVTRNSLHARLQMIPEQQTFSFPPDFWSVGRTWKNEQEWFCSLHMLGAQNCLLEAVPVSTRTRQSEIWEYSHEFDPHTQPNQMIYLKKKKINLPWFIYGQHDPDQSKTDWIFSCLCRHGLSRGGQGKPPQLLSWAPRG